MTNLLRFAVTLFATLSISVTAGAAGVCTQATIESALSTSGKFIWKNECTNADVSISTPIIVGSSQLVDGSGKMRILWKGKHPCDEKPSKDTIFTVNGSGSVLKNFTIEWSPEGIHLMGNNNVVDGVVYKKICEDGLTNYGKNNVVRNSLFQNAPDKCIQTNGGSALFENNTFRNCPRSIGSCSDKADPGNHPLANCQVPSFNTARRNRVEGCSGSYGMRASGKKSKNADGWLKAYENTFTNCKYALQAEEDGVVYAKGNTIRGGAGFRGLAHGKLYDCKNTLSGAEYSSGNKPVKSCDWDK